MSTKRFYNHRMQQYVELDNFDLAAEREGKALQFQAKNRTDNRYRRNRKQERFTKIHHLLGD